MFRVPSDADSETERTALRGQVQQLTQELQAQQVTVRGLLQQAAQQQQPQQGPRLPNSVKLEKPQVFKGQVDGAIVDTFLYQCELYFGLAGVTDQALQVQFATLLLVDDAALWLRSQYAPADIRTLTWQQLATALRDQFRPVDHPRRARDRLANCRQTGGVQGYTAAFRRILVQCSDVGPAEALDRYVRGLIPQVRQMVLVQDPQTWESAAVTADRVATAGRPYQGPQRGGGQSSSGPTPMELGTTWGSHGGGRSSGRSGWRGGGRRGRGRVGSGGRSGPIVCWNCQQPGHTKRECPQRQQGN